MKVRRRWLIVVGVLVVAGLVIAWALNRGTPAQQLTQLVPMHCIRRRQRVGRDR